MGNKQITDSFKLTIMESMPVEKVMINNAAFIRITHVRITLTRDHAIFTLMQGEIDIITYQERYYGGAMVLQINRQPDYNNSLDTILVESVRPGIRHALSGRKRMRVTFKLGADVIDKAYQDYQLGEPCVFSLDGQDVRMRFTMLEA